MAAVYGGLECVRNMRVLFCRHPSSSYTARHRYTAEEAPERDLALSLRTKNEEPGKKHEFAEFLDSLRLSDTQKLREKLEVTKFRDSLGLRV